MSHSLGLELYLDSPLSEFWLLWDLVATAVTTTIRLSRGWETREWRKEGTEKSRGFWLFLRALEVPFPASVARTREILLESFRNFKKLVFSVFIKVPHEFHAALSSGHGILEGKSGK